MSRDCAVWLRVSTGEQETDNQVPDVERFCAHHDLNVVRTFRLDDSAWKDGVGGPEYRAALKAALDGAWMGEFEVIVVRALDRITRFSAEDALRLVRIFHERGAVILSVQESWLSSSPEIVDVLVAFAGWNAKQQSDRRSEQVKIGMARAKAAGKVIGGRKPGAEDRRSRRTDGYRARYAQAG